MPKPAILGKVVRDRITGFRGTATSITDYLYGTNRVGVEARNDQSGDAMLQYFEEPRLEIIPE